MSILLYGAELYAGVVLVILTAGVLLGLFSIPFLMFRKRTHSHSTMKTRPFLKFAGPFAEQPWKPRPHR